MTNDWHTIWSILGANTSIQCFTNLWQLLPYVDHKVVIRLFRHWRPILASNVLPIYAQRCLIWHWGWHKVVLTLATNISIQCFINLLPMIGIRLGQYWEPILASNVLPIYDQCWLIWITEVGKGLSWYWKPIFSIQCFTNLLAMIGIRLVQYWEPILAFNLLPIYDQWLAYDLVNIGSQY